MAGSSLLEPRQAERREARQEASPRKVTNRTVPNESGKRGKDGGGSSHGRLFRGET